MGYTIRYGPHRLKKRKRPALTLAVLALLAALAIHVVWPESIAKTWELLFPTISQSQDAFQEMVAQIRGGEPLGDAVTAFCQEVIDRAELDDVPQN